MSDYRGSERVGTQSLSIDQGLRAYMQRVYNYMAGGLVVTGAVAYGAYSAAVLKSWLRARFIAALLVGLYALLFVLLNLEAWSLLIGSVLLFVALAGVMYATRNVDWNSVGKKEAAV